MANKYREGTTYLYLRMPEELKRRLFEAARKAGKPATQLAREAVEEKVASLEKNFKNPLDR